MIYLEEKWIQTAGGEDGLDEEQIILLPSSAAICG
jgi:hypothetical protein